MLWHLDADGRGGRKIALKEVEIDGPRAGRVEREISILSALSHPHIISLLGSERTETRHGKNSENMKAVTSVCVI